MKDDRKEHGKRDRAWIEDDESWELRWLAQELGVNVDEVGDATKEARLIVSPVQQRLGRY